MPLLLQDRQPAQQRAAPHVQKSAQGLGEGGQAQRVGTHSRLRCGRRSPGAGAYGCVLRAALGCSRRHLCHLAPLSTLGLEVQHLLPADGHHGVAWGSGVGGGGTWLGGAVWRYWGPDSAGAGWRALMAGRAQDAAAPRSPPKRRCKLPALPPCSSTRAWPIACSGAHPRCSLRAPRPARSARWSGGRSAHHPGSQPRRAPARGGGSCLSVMGRAVGGRTRAGRRSAPAGRRLRARCVQLTRPAGGEPRRCVIRQAGCATAAASHGVGRAARTTSPGRKQSYITILSTSVARTS